MKIVMLLYFRKTRTSCESGSLRQRPFAPARKVRKRRWKRKARSCCLGRSFLRVRIQSPHVQTHIHDHSPSKFTREHFGDNDTALLLRRREDGGDREWG